MDLKQIYDQIPPMDCRNCGDCCGPVPFNVEEARACGRAENKPLTAEPCEFLKEEKCSVYPNRPFICRLFGTADSKYLKCPHGCAPKSCITKEKAAHLAREYHRLSNQKGK